MILNNLKKNQKPLKNFLFISPYGKVIKILNSLKDYILTNNNNNKAIEELDWVINVISNNLLYSFQKTLYYMQNIQKFSGNHKIKDFSNEVDFFNQESSNFHKKYLKIEKKIEDFENYIKKNENNISIENKYFKAGNNDMVNPYINNSSVDILKKIKKSKKFFSQFSTQLLNDYNQLILGNNSITDIYYTDKNGFISKKDISYNLNKLKKMKDLSFNSQESTKNINNKNSLYNNYKIYSISSLNSKNKRNQNISRFLNKENIDNSSVIISNNLDGGFKKINLPLIQYNIDGGGNLDKNQINNYNKKNNFNLHHQKTENEKKNIINFGKDYKKINIPMIISSNINVDSIFDYENFNIFNLKDKLGLDNVLPFLGKEIIKKINLKHFFEEPKLDKFLKVLSQNYENNKALYHTSLHGADVCYSTYLILTLLKNKENIIPNMSKLDIISLIISGLSHDIGHPGLTNKFLINSKNEISLIYNDISVLENFHCYKTFQLLQEENMNIFNNFSNEDFLLIRKKMIGEILSTDMAIHSKIIEDFKEYKKNKDNNLKQNQLNFITHIADLSHNFKKFEISIKWVELLSNEFWNQGDEEKKLGLPVSFLCDREDINIPKSQISFIKTFLMNTIQELIEVNINFEIMKNNAANNLKIWEKLEKEKRKKGWTPDKGKNRIINEYNTNL